MPEQEGQRGLDWQKQARQGKKELANGQFPLIIGPGKSEWGRKKEGRSREEKSRRGETLEVLRLPKRENSSR